MTQSLAEECGIDLKEALAAAVLAAKNAGLIMLECYKQRQAEVAAAFMPPAPLARSTNVNKSQSKTQNNSTNHLGDSKCGVASVYEGSAPATESSRLEDPSSPVFTHNANLQIEQKTCSTDLVTQYDKQIDATITAFLEQYNARVTKDHPDITFSFITEELNPNVPISDALTWIVDPIDGTMSFVHNLHDCCVCIGLAYKKQPILGVVFCPFIHTGRSVLHFIDNISCKSYNRRNNQNVLHQSSAASAKSDSSQAFRPHSATEAHAQEESKDSPRGAEQDESSKQTVTSSTKIEESSDDDDKIFISGDMYTAIRGRGCFLNGYPVSVNHRVQTFQDAVFALSYPFGTCLTAEECASADVRDIQRARHEAALDAAARIRMALHRYPVRQLRMYGSCAVTLALIASGYLDLYVEPGGKVWDVCAASLLVTEAGGYVCNLVGDAFDMSRDTTIVAGSSESLVRSVVELLKEHSYDKFYLR